jgi:type VI secretion system protein ImpA
MALREDLLKPISEDNPSGESLKYSPIVDKIKEARRQDDDAPQGDWQRERKVADFGQVSKLATDLLTTKTKDLQLAAWLTEAWLHREGFHGLLDGLKLLHSYIENFWDSVHPQIQDEEDLELRAAPLSWVGSYLDTQVKHTGLTVDGLSFFQYKESRTIAPEEDVAYDDARREARETAIAEGKTTPEEWDKSYGATSADFYEEAKEVLESLLEELENFGILCEEKFGVDYTPSFSKLRTALEEVHNTVRTLHRDKGAPPKSKASATEEETSSSSSEDDSWGSGWGSEEETPAAESTGGGAAAAPARAPRKVTSLQPADREDAIDRVVAAAEYMRSESLADPAPYLMLRGLRWGELRADGETPDQTKFEAPPTEIRQAIKRASLEGSWTEVLENTEKAAGLPCGRAWLDLHRYTVKACEEMGYTAVAEAIKSELRALIAAYPDLPTMSLMDDTPTANGETQGWLKEIAPAADAAPQIVYTPPPSYDEDDSWGSSSSSSDESEGDDKPAPPPDAYELAMNALRGGRQQEALELLTHEVARQTTGRGRFQRKLQLAQICIGMGHDRIAHSILEQLAANIDDHRLEDWESPEMLANALALYYQCMNKVDGADPALAQKLYTRICRLDPIQALAHAR